MTKHVDIDALDEVHGGASQPLYAEVNRTPGGWFSKPTYDHSYAQYGEGLGTQQMYSDANAQLQRFNAPTRDALYNGGNDPNATSGTISQPYGPVDWGGEVSLQHHDGWARNTTDFLHPLEGQISRYLVQDSRDSQFHVVTAGQGSGGYDVSRALTPSALPDPQMVGHVVNPGLGFESFRQLDAAQRTDAGIPDTYVPSAYNAANTSADLGAQLLTGNHARINYQNDPTTALLGDTVRQLESNGGVNGMLTVNVDNTISRVNSDGTRDTFARGADGGVQQLAYDEFRGIDQAMDRWGSRDPGAPQNAPSTPTDSGNLGSGFDQVAQPQYPTEAPNFDNMGPVSPGYTDQQTQDFRNDLSNYQDTASPPQQSYEAPQQNYEAPQQNYEAPQENYSQPPGEFAE